jgi:hypothetical protein
MLKQTLTGKFTMRLKGYPFLFTGDTVLEPEKVEGKPSNNGRIRSFHIGPLVIGLAWKA